MDHHHYDHMANGLIFHQSYIIRLIFFSLWLSIMSIIIIDMYPSLSLLVFFHLFWCFAIRIFSVLFCFVLYPTRKYFFHSFIHLFGIFSFIFHSQNTCICVCHFGHHTNTPHTHNQPEYRYCQFLFVCLFFLDFLFFHFAIASLYAMQSLSLFFSITKTCKITRKKIIEKPSKWRNETKTLKKKIPKDNVYEKFMHKHTHIASLLVQAKKTFCEMYERYVCTRIFFFHHHQHHCVCVCVFSWLFSSKS